MAFLVKSAVKQYCAKKGMRTGADALVHLDKVIQHLLDEAIRRAKESKVGTIKSKHV